MGPGKFSLGLGIQISRVLTSLEKWLLKLNISKSKTVSYCMKNMIDTEYFLMMVA